MKARSDAEVVGAEALERDVKLGVGGIREIEFVAQSMQLLNAGRFPFLQTHSTAQALELLARYGRIDPAEAARLTEAYWFLRRVEHRLQIREEEQTHIVPGDAAELESLARSLGFEAAAQFEAVLGEERARAREVYAELFADRGFDSDFEAWWTFLTTDHAPQRISALIESWLGANPEAAEGLRVFARGGRHMPVTRELVVRFQHVASAFDGFHDRLARPLQTLSRLSRFAERYGTRQQFLGFCAENPGLFRTFAILFDRSESVAELLRAHPEIVDEVIRPEVLRRRSRRAVKGEITAASRMPGFRDWLWLFVRAEQVRHALCGILGTLGPEEIESEMTGLAEAVLRELSRDSGLLVVALGKLGSGELSFGSDLDLMFVAHDGSEAEAAAAVDSIRSLLGGSGPLGPAFEIDMRLRPHGHAGPLATSVAALDTYHRGGGGQVWEKQALVRARIVAGEPAFAAEFESWRGRLLYSAPASDGEIREVLAMRLRVERELGAGPPGLAFKAGAGGLADIGYLTQAFQMRHGHLDPALRVQGTRAALRALAGRGLLAGAPAGRLLDNYEFLRRIETALRLDSNRAAISLPTEPDDCKALAVWLGFGSFELLMAEHSRRLAETREIYGKLPSLLELTTAP
jgi:glutamate-ammonia-ligase adenylyltransferase